VRDAGTDDVYGNYILIDHGDGLESMYGHASRLFVRAGDRVERNEVIALSGSTGRSTAPHLHFEVRKDGEPVDPLTYVTQPS
jgi:murein DD-endopeptidase MepM/ murein hydrolase activator NlpD